MNISRMLQSRLASALEGLVEPARIREFASLVKPSGNPAHGDYQANCAMPLGKLLAQSPRTVAEQLVARLDLGLACGPPEIAGPGFLNFRLQDAWIAQQVRALAGDPRLGVEPLTTPRTIVIDYSSPNVAKPLHVGHLRSTIIGDAIKKILTFLGHRVISDNHLGDWGTQFGILIYGYKHFRDEAAFARDPVAELARLYILVRRQFKADEDDEAGNDPVQQACREETAKLHQGDPENLALWQMFMPYCLQEIDCIYQRLGITFDYTLGESFYQPMLAEVVDDLRRKKLAVETDGAIGIFLSEKEGDPPALVRKRDGAFTYTTTDLATIRYRVEHFQADEALYVVDARQALHFKNLFEIARRWGYDQLRLEHVSFGSVLDAQGKPFKSREGGVPLLEELLNQAVAAARSVFEQSLAEAAERGEEVPIFSEAEARRIHEVVGIGAVKYADLSQNRNSDYRFDPVKMTDMKGNTATYMQYAYARTKGIVVRKGRVDPETLWNQPPVVLLASPPERALALALLRFPEAVEAAAADYRPNLISTYLWELSTTFNGFFQACPVLKADTLELRQSRLLLCDLTARLIQKGLHLLGIETVERM
ncbi:MAG: arginine--tRNA ligase [Gemmataceae bacterium]